MAKKGFQLPPVDNPTDYWILSGSLADWPDHRSDFRTELLTVGKLKYYLFSNCARVFYDIFFIVP